MSDGSSDFIDPAEACPWRRPREILARSGYVPLPPNELDDQQLPGRLWELIYAAAARRFYFHSTDHLSDRNLYRLLWDEWLDIPTPDIPPEAETNTRTCIADFDAGGLTAEEIDTRYYSDAEVEADLPTDGATDGRVTPEETPYERDRFLPAPVSARGVPPEWSEDAAEDDESAIDEHDPLGLNKVDLEIAAKKEDSTRGSTDLESTNPGWDSEATEAQLSESEPDKWTQPAEELVSRNIPLLPPAEITDEMLGPILWELLHNLALRGFYLLHTNHLTDRELYAELWERGLRDPAHLPGRNPHSGWFHDIIGSYREEETQIWLRYYATDEERAKHSLQQPKDSLPPR